MLFKNNNPGFSFIETMVAIVLLAIFGTSLFMVQTDIFFKTSKAHNKVIHSLALAKIQSIIELNTFKLSQQKKPLTHLKLQETFSNPTVQLEVNVKSIPENSPLNKDIFKNVKLMHLNISTDSATDKFTTFIFSPPVKTKDET